MVNVVQIALYCCCQCNCVNFSTLAGPCWRRWIRPSSCLWTAALHQRTSWVKRHAGFKDPFGRHWILLKCDSASVTAGFCDKNKEMIQRKIPFFTSCWQEWHVQPHAIIEWSRQNAKGLQKILQHSKQPGDNPIFLSRPVCTPFMELFLLFMN